MEPRDGEIIDQLSQALEHLGHAERMLQVPTSSDAWPTIGRLLSEVLFTMKQIELHLIGIGLHQ